MSIIQNQVLNGPKYNNITEEAIGTKKTYLFDNYLQQAQMGSIHLFYYIGMIYCSQDYQLGIRICNYIAKSIRNYICFWNI